MNKLLYDALIFEQQKIGLKFIEENKITQILFNSIEYQPNYNGLNIEAQCYSGEVKLEDDFEDDLVDVLLPYFEINFRNGVIPVSDLIQLFGQIVFQDKTEQVLLYEDVIEIEIGDDS